MNVIFQQKNIRVSKIAEPRKGFVALITAIVLSVILMTVTVSLNQVGFLARSEVLDSEYKDRSSALAEACVDTALLKLANDPAYTVTTPTSVTVGSDTCSIDSVGTVGTQIAINTSAVFPLPSITSQGAFTRLQIVVNSSDLTVVSWNEVP